MSTPPRIPRWLLERVVLDELPRPLTPDTRARLEASPPTDAERRALEEENARFLVTHPPALFLGRARAEQRRAAPARWRGPAAGLLLAAVTASLVLLVRPPVGDDGRLKGLNPALSVYRKAAAGAEQLADGAPVHPGDVLQIRYRAAGRPYGVIVSVDGARNVTLHWPAGTGAPAALQPSGESTLPQAYRLDAAPRFERFFFVTSTHPLRTAEVVGAVQTWADGGFTASGPSLPAGAQVSTLTFPKGGE